MAIRLQTRLLLAVGIVALSAVAAVAVSARLGTRLEFDKFQNIERKQDVRVRSAMGALVQTLDHRCCDAQTLGAATASLVPGDAAFVFAANGELLAAIGEQGPLVGTTATLAGDVLTIRSKAAGPGVTAGMAIMLKGAPSAPISLATGEPATVHVATMPSEDSVPPAQQFLGSLDRRLLWVTISVGALALLATWVMARRIGRPIADLNRATRDLARGDFSRRVAPGGSDELGDLARAFNRMAAELERQQTLRRNLVHDVAHELRTPLTSLRCRLETVIDGLAADPKPAMQQANDEVAHLSQLVADLEELARAEAGELAIASDVVALADVARSSLRVAGLDADPRIRLELEPERDGRGVFARGDAVRIRQIVVNLLTNADRHTPADGVITMRVRSRDGRALIDVHNTGSALTPDEAGHVFDRFYRADPARQRATGGSGLGLAIVKHLSEVQNGSACVTSDASGVTFSVSLPAAD
jgi:signal transduction histidine kinase